MFNKLSVITAPIVSGRLSLSVITAPIVSGRLSLCFYISFFISCGIHKVIIIIIIVQLKPSSS